MESYNIYPCYYNMIEVEPSSFKKIQQIRLGFPKDYGPHKYMSPYTLMNELNKVVKSKYDIQFIHIKYIQTKNRQQKNLQTLLLDQNSFQVDRNFNNIFDNPSASGELQSMINFIFNKIEKLKPPSDFIPEDEDKQRQNELKEYQLKRLISIKEKIQGIMKIYNQKNTSKIKEQEICNIKSIQSFKLAPDKQFQNHDYEIYAKAIMNQPVYERIRQDSKEKANKSLIQFKYREGVTIKIYLNPTPQEDSIDRINNEYLITNWSLNTYYEQKFINYFGTEGLGQNVRRYNQSIVIVSSVSFNQNAGKTESFAITSYLWNQTVLKVVVKLAQVERMERCKKGNQYQIYFHLKYPPMYYISELKKDEANSQKYMKFTDRVTNFVLLENSQIADNYFIRYFLFNNSFLRVSIDLENQLPAFGGYSAASEAQMKLQQLFNLYNGTLKNTNKEQFYKSKYKLKLLIPQMDFKSFNQSKKIHTSKQMQDKMWMIKYLILVMVRYNYIIPNTNQISSIMRIIEDEKNLENIDCYLYVLWRTATNMWGYQDEKRKFFQFFKQETQEVKKMNVKNKNIMKRILEESDSIVYIFRVSFTPSGYLFNPPTPQMKGRVLKQFASYSQFFLRISLAQENQIQLKNQKYITRIFFRKHMNEIKILGRAYDPLGWSPSQLRSFSLWYFHPIAQRKQINLKDLRRDNILQFLGDFKKIQNPAKKAARIGQSFSSSWTYSAMNIKQEIINDIYSSERFCFTDGIGKISGDLLQKISTKLNIRDLSVIQIRYKGAKGVLVLDPQLSKNTIHLRPTMIKYDCKNDKAKQYLDILDWNKFKVGLLNRQVIILLRTLGIQDTIFANLQKQHIQKISKMTFKDCSIFKYMGQDVNTDINNLEPATKTILSLLNSGFQLQKQPFFRGVLQTLKKNGYHQLKVKSNIMVEKSVRVIGIIDEDGILQQNQVYCAIYDHFAQKPIRQVRDQKAIITRNPCLDPADIRVVKCVGKDEIQERFLKLGKINKFQQLWNVVIMPIKGKIPLTAQISGSDLDGDNFFVCWDERLIPTQVCKASLIDDPIANNKKQQKPLEQLTNKQQYEKMLDFFIDYTNYQKLGQIDNSHLVHADRDLINYAYNQKCMKLCKIHGKAVDFPKTGFCPPVDPDLFCSEYPDFMEKQNAKEYVSTSILGKLYRDIKSRIQSLLQDKVYVGVTEVDKSLIFDFKFDYTHEQLKSCLTILRQYQREMVNLITLIGVDSQYEIYSGNFSTVKNKLKAFGKNRLIATILNMRQRFLQFFFTDLQEDQENYKKVGPSEDFTKKINYFSEDARKKAQLYYLVSYICKFPQINQNIQGFDKLKVQIRSTLQEMKVINKEQKFCGFVWFIIPKIIINLKMRHRQIKQKQTQSTQGENTIENTTENISKQEQEQEYI